MPIFITFCALSDAKGMDIKMNIEKLVESLGEAGAKVLFNKERRDSIVFDIEAMGEGEILAIILKKLTYEGKFNEAENIIFDKLEKEPTKELCKVASEFYNTLLTKSNEELLLNNFSKEEIYQGLEDIDYIERSLI